LLALGLQAATTERSRVLKGTHFPRQKQENGVSVRHVFLMRGMFG
jgi:hypothetical protein